MSLDSPERKGPCLVQRHPVRRRAGFPYVQDEDRHVPAAKMFRCKTVRDSGALVTWSSDNIVFGDFQDWNPYLGMEIGMTRWANEKTVLPAFRRTPEPLPPTDEKMSIEEMLLGYTINGAIQLGIEDAKGSIEVGKDADFLVFENDLLSAEHEGFSQNEPTEVYFGGVKMN